MSFYELVFIVRPDVVTTQVDSLVDKFKTVISEKGGQVASFENWGLRTLAYRIKKHRRGYYVMLNVEGTGEIINEVERQMRINEDIIRFLTIRVEELNEGPSVMMAPKKSRRFDEADKKTAEPAA
jgi:small subunit ribosomal protein S6